MKNLKIEKIYVADNGDVILKTNEYYKEVENEEVAELVNEALKIYVTGLHEVDGKLEPFEEIEKCTYKENQTPFPSYYDSKNEFIGNLGIHVLPKYSIFQNLILIKTNNKEFAKELTKLTESMQEIIKADNKKHSKIRGV